MGIIQVFKELAFENAESFLDALSPHKPGELWDRSDQETWIFRGQGNAAWGLVPSAFRKDGQGNPVLMQYDAAQVQSLPYSAQEQRHKEYNAIIAFMGRANDAGFEIPGDHPHLRDGYGGAVSLSEAEFPPQQYLWSFALGQHYGIPTRLLDWSSGAKIALWFAARSASELLRGSEVSKRPGRLAVWAVNSEFLRSHTNDWDPRPRIVTVPTVSNPNLHAQRGLFTIVDVKETAIRNPATLEACFDINAAKATATLGSDGVPLAPMLLKLTVPATEAGYLLHCLAIEGVDVATLHPWLGAVKESLLDERHRQRDRPAGRSPGRRK